MKSLAFSVLILTAGLFAQTAAPAQSSTAGTPPPQHPHMMAMQQHMQAMKAQMAKMQSNVEQMKSNAPKIKDPAARQQADLDAQMWQMMVDHMQSMEKMMAEHEGGMMHGGIHHPMHHPATQGTPPPSSQPQ